MSGLLIVSLLSNVILFIKLVHTIDDRNLYQQRASYWLEKYNEK